MGAEQSDSRKRIEFIDLAKGVCILLVLAFHADLFDSCWLKNLRMPLYYVLSGLFFKDYGGIGSTALKKINRLIVPALFFTLGGLCCALYLGYDTHRLYAERQTIIDAFNQPMWFLVSLFMLNLIFCILLYIKNSMPFIGIMSIVMYLTAYLIEGIFHPAPGGRWLYILQSLGAAPYFFMGWYLRNTPFLHEGESRWDSLQTGVDLIVLSGAFFLATGSYSDIFYLHGHLPVLSVVCGALFVAGLLLCLKGVRRFPYISWLGRYSVIVLGVHLWALEWVKNYVGKYGMWDSSEYGWLHFIGCIVLSSLAIWPLKKFFPWFTAQKDLIPMSVIDRIKEKRRNKG